MFIDGTSFGGSEVELHFVSFGRKQNQSITNMVTNL